jgi:hypothetical protein
MRTHPAPLERRRQLRHRGAGYASRSHLIDTVAGMYKEMPGLCLHLRQAARLFGIDLHTCRQVLDSMVASGRLRRLDDGQYAAH